MYVVEAVRILITVFLLMMCMHIIYPYNQTAQCRSYTDKESCTRGGFQILDIFIHHPCEWVILPNDIIYRNCKATYPTTSLKSMLIIAFAVSVTSNVISTLLGPIFQVMKLSLEDSHGKLQ